MSRHRTLRYNHFNSLPFVDTSAEFFSRERSRAARFVLLLVIVNLVMDGWNGRPGGLLHQWIVLPFTVVFLWGVYALLKPIPGDWLDRWTTLRTIQLVFLFELAFVGIYLYEVRHFSDFGYALRPVLAAGLIGGGLLLMAWSLRQRVSGVFVFCSALATSTAGFALSILSFPLNYLRSDMLPVIGWANHSLLQHLDPYRTLHVGARLYDFPYLPGMMLAFYPFAWAGVDLRFGSLAYLLGAAGLVFWAARTERQRDVGALVGLFLLCPFLQYRHELYLEPHWFTLVLVLVLMQRRRFGWAALTFGLSMAIYQFSWILFPFFLLNGLRRRGWIEVAKLVGLGAIGILALTGPFLRSASHRIANNTVGQWGHLSAHATAEPMNLSFWVTYLIHPDKLLRLQAVLMVGIFVYCLVRGRCADVVDTLRWMIVALTTFVLFNVLVDGYFYLMLLVLMLAFTCVANSWWAEPEVSAAVASS